MLQLLETRLGPGHPSLQFPAFQFNPAQTADISEIEHALNLAQKVRSGAIPAVPGLPLISSLASLGLGMGSLGKCVALLSFTWYGRIDVQEPVQAALESPPVVCPCPSRS